MEELRYPIGRFNYPGNYTSDERNSFIKDFAGAPSHLRNAIKELTEDQLNTAYRPEGWKVREVVGHLVDSHVNAYTRLKLALTEDNPEIKVYNEVKWASLADTVDTPPAISCNLIEALHIKMVNLFRSLSESDFKRTFLHPENGPMNVENLLGSYAWHGKHHVAHITSLKKRMNWD